MTDPRFIRPSDRRPPEEYPEWLQSDAEYHAPRRWPETAARLATGAGVLLLVLALHASLSTWRDQLASATIWPDHERPVAP